MTETGASAAKGPLRTLLIDNADSFTLNLFHLLAEVNGCAPTLVPNDWAEFSLDVLSEFDNVVISPGPGTPEKSADFGICAEVIAQSPIPVLGVCLGHQGIAHMHGGVVVHAPEPRHGRVSPISHSGTGLFAGLPSPFSAVRYHSLAVTELPESLEATAWSEDGVIMAVQHRTRPQWGVQFHPESIASEEARVLLRNFADLTVEWSARRTRANVPAGTGTVSAQRFSTFRVPAGTLSGSQSVRAADDRSFEPRRYIVDTDELPQTIADARLFAELFGSRRESIWLDGNLTGDASSRFSIMGAPTGPLAKVATASVPDGKVTVRTSNDEATPSVAASGFFDWLDAELSSTDVELAPSETESFGTDAELPATNADNPDLPFEFRLGWVGYLGYELKAEVGSPNQHESELPDAVMMFLDRALVIDHDTDRIHLLALRKPNDPAGTAASQQWFDDIRTRIEAIPAHDAGEPVQPGATSATGEETASAGLPRPHLSARHSRQEYLGLIDRIQREITDGETYELCLTNMLEATVAPHEDALATYLRLSQDNPTPFGAFIRTRDAAILSTSPERFLRIDANGRVESKPIKGTRPRRDTPEEDEAIKVELAASVKDRSENLMIVDLVRHDLGRTAELGSVQVDTLFGIESYATVHQMVSTVSSQLDEQSSPVECVRAAFPPGSMTGAPKQRTMAIIDELEAGARGVYSGAVGYFSLNGAVDLSVVIRTLVVRGETWRYGVGGAIVVLSDSDEEYAETVVKAAPLLRLLGGAEFPGGTGPADMLSASSEYGDDIHTVIPAEMGGPASIDVSAQASGVGR
ncbi:aminodeoxychorismate synthase component I [Brevibacterium atlanticum]|uniref:aminodeoxychorismate synthase component I n=1 Tax=Brevibacterium atlanticum TaxID=2697563 RepID=UPI001D187AC7|nr:aminodeoxychorismate synthase component I [Brevibacterium atlanticum]